MLKFITRLCLFLICLLILGSCVFYTINRLSEPAYEIIEEGEYYQITRSNDLFYYRIFNQAHDIVKSDGPVSRQPHIDLVSDDLLRFTVQSGTGIATQWGFFYHIKRNEFSPIFHCIYDQSDVAVAYRENSSIIIQDIFGEHRFEISSFQKPLAELADPILSVEFIEDGTKIQVNYLSGRNLLEITDVIDLPDWNP